MILSFNKQDHPCKWDLLWRILYDSPWILAERRTITLEHSVWQSLNPCWTTDQYIGALCMTVPDSLLNDGPLLWSILNDSPRTPTVWQSYIPGTVRCARPQNIPCSDNIFELIPVNFGPLYSDVCAFLSNSYHHSLSTNRCVIYLLYVEAVDSFGRLFI